MTRDIRVHSYLISNQTPNLVTIGQTIPKLLLSDTDVGL